MSLSAKVLFLFVFHFNEALAFNFSSLMDVLLVLYLKTHQQIQGHTDFSPVFSSRSFKALALTHVSVPV